MKKVGVIGCGSYMDSGYGCPGEWRCLKAAALGEGKFDGPTQVLWHLKCQCPGRSTLSNVGMSIKMSEIKPDAIYVSSCMANAMPQCPYRSAEEMATALQDKFGVDVILGTHEYH